MLKLEVCVTFYCLIAAHAREEWHVYCRRVSASLADDSDNNKQPRPSATAVFLSFLPRLFISFPLKTRGRRLTPRRADKLLSYLHFSASSLRATNRPRECGQKYWMACYRAIKCTGCRVIIAWFLPIYRSNKCLFQRLGINNYWITRALCFYN